MNCIIFCQKDVIFGKFYIVWCHIVCHIVWRHNVTLYDVVCHIVTLYFLNVTFRKLLPYKNIFTGFVALWKPYSDKKQCISLNIIFCNVLYYKNTFTGFAALWKPYSERNNTIQQMPCFATFLLQKRFHWICGALEAPFSHKITQFTESHLL